MPKNLTKIRYEIIISMLNSDSKLYEQLKVYFK